jgi:hypothetical protein
MADEAGEAGGLDLENPNLEIAVFGREVEDFIENDRIGRYLVEKARRDLEEAKEHLVDCPLADVPEWQRKAAIANAIRGYLADAIRDGKAAEILIEQERDHVA